MDTRSPDINWIIITERDTEQSDFHPLAHIPLFSSPANCISRFKRFGWEQTAQSGFSAENDGDGGRRKAATRHRYATVSFHFTAQLKRFMGWKKWQKGFSNVPSRPADDLFNHYFCVLVPSELSRERTSRISEQHSALMNAKRSENLTHWTLARSWSELGACKVQWSSKINTFETFGDSSTWIM